MSQAEFAGTFAAHGIDYSTNPNLKFLYDATGTDHPHPAGSKLPDNQGINALHYLQNKGAEHLIVYNGLPNHASVSVSITESQANMLTEQSEIDHLNILLKAWKGASGVDFTHLPTEAQTALMDITFNYGGFDPRKTGSLLPDAALAAATMNSQGHGIEWNQVANDIAHLSSNHNRMLTDANLVRQLLPAGSTLPGLPTSQPATSVAANTSTYGFSVADAVTQYAFDPTGSTTYALIANPGSPNISSIQLPIDSAESYLVSYQVGTHWSAPKAAQPDQIVNLPADVTGVQVQLLDASGNAAPDTDFVFFVTFANSGNFSGNVYDLTGAPSVAVTTSNSNLNLANDSATITFAFSDAVTDFSLADLTANGGTLSNLSGSGTTYTATFTGALGLNIHDASVSVVLGSYHDTNGNAGNGGSTANFAVDTVSLVNAPPVTNPDSVGVQKGNTLTISAAKGVLANDIVPNVNDHLTVASVNGAADNVGHSVQGQYGTLTLNADGSYSYTAKNGSLPSQIVPQDIFSYSVSDGHGGNGSSTLTITVLSPSQSYQAGSNTTLNGGNGPDVLDGTAGHAILLGGNGPDVLIGGPGGQLAGGNGPDVYVFGRHFGLNTVTDFDVNNDAIQVSKSLFASVTDLLNRTADSTSGAIITASATDQITLVGVTKAQLVAHQGDFYLV